MSRFNSQNFFIAVSNILVGFWAFNDIAYTFDVSAFFQGGVTIESKVLIILNLLNPVFKTIAKFQNKELVWKDFLKSRNFRTNAASALVLVLGIWLNADWAGLITATVFNAINIVSHVNDDK